ncbi:MAG: DUF58 domain-containing protein [Planctomycetales bacterium]|nr:DUF58 domain-containing protein [Planctomycetales bacterium]
MTTPVLSRYLDPAVLSYVAEQPLHPQGLVIGNLAGAHKSPLSGFAVEFSGHREYVPGDDPRHIDWRVYFAREKFFLKQYELETNFVCHLLLDVSASMRYGDGDEQKLLFAARALTTLGYSVLRQNDKVSFATFDSHLHEHVPPSNSMGQIHRMTRRLDETEPEHRTDAPGAINALAARIQRREIVVIFSDLLGVDLEQLEAALQRLRYGRHEVVLFHVLHAHELRFEFEGMVRFLGLESDDRLLTQTEDLRDAYLKVFQQFRSQVEEIAHRNTCEYVIAETRGGLRDLFVDYLHRQR